MTPRRLVALALNPGLILKAQGMQPDPWQRDLLLSSAPHLLLNCSRGAGKSRTCSVLALHTALFQPGSLVLLLSRALRQAVELLRYVKQGWRALGRPLPAQKLSETQLELANGSRVISLPGREETIRSFQGVALLIIDEAARVPDALYYSVRPMLNVSRGRLVCLSTPFGARGFFWREWHDTRADWERVKVTWEDCPRIAPEAIADERRAMGDLWVAQEYECSFVSLEGLVYPDFDQALLDQETIPEGRVVGGIDFGWRNPFAAVWGVLDEADVLWIVGEHYGSQIALHQHAAALRDLGPVTWYADPAGRTEIEEFRTAGLRVLPGINEIRPGVAAVTARLRTGRLRVLRPRCPHLIAEASLYRYPTAQERRGESELPLDAHNHALGALRYLVSRIDTRYLARLRRKAPSTEEKAPLPPLSPFDQEEGWTRIG
jgi:Terminase large subunit, T4likevirus-type, N-terminal/Terminase RNaseH-like domain